MDGAMKQICHRIPFMDGSLTGTERRRHCKDRTMWKSLQGQNNVEVLTGTEQCGSPYRDRTMWTSLQGQNNVEVLTGTESCGQNCVVVPTMTVM